MAKTVNVERVLGTYTLTSGGFNGSGATYFQGIVGNGYNGTQTTSSYYSSSSGSRAYFTYDMSFNIPSNATVTALSVKVNGHAESTSQSNEYMTFRLKSGSTYFTNLYNFKSAGTSNTTITQNATTLPTASQLSSMVLECSVGWYGGAINGATCYVTYTLPEAIYYKDNDAWIEPSAVYKKVSGSWVKQSDLTTVFDTNTNYVRGNLILRNLIPDGDMESSSWNGGVYDTTTKYIGSRSQHFTSGSTIVMSIAMPTLPIVGHKYYGRHYLKTNGNVTANDCRFEWYAGDGVGLNFVFGYNQGNHSNWTMESNIVTVTAVNGTSYICRSFTVNATSDVWADGLMIVDLTASFGSGNEPSKAWCDANIPFFVGTTTIDNPNN